MTIPQWSPADLDLSIPSTARVYDCLLGGAHNFAADREFAEQVSAVLPASATAARANRAFVHRAVAFMADQGITQFLDLGSGIPTAGTVHETARHLCPNARVLYVDHDAVAVAYSRLVFGEVPGIGILRGQIQNLPAVLGSPELAAVIDLSRPVGLLLASVLPFVPDSDRPGEAVAMLRRALAPGSMLAISHVVPEEYPHDTREAAELYRATSASMTVRTAEEVATFFGDWEMAEPGLDWTSYWRPRHPKLADHGGKTYAVAGLARKP